MKATRSHRTGPPWWLRISLGLVILALGVWLIFRPFASLRVLVGVVAVGLVLVGSAQMAEQRSGVAVRALGGLWVIAGLVVFFWPSPTVRMITLLVGVHLIVDGVGDVVDSVRARTDQRIAGLLLGLATIIFGVLALLWPDITVLVIAIVFAGRLIVLGLSRIVATFKTEEPDRPAGRFRRWMNVLGAVVALVVAGGLALLSTVLNNARPVVDDFYAAPDSVPPEPGMLLRVEEFSRGIPDRANGWRILYTTTRDEGQPAIASALVVAPEQVEGGAPVIAWAHGTTGVAETCAPSVLEGTFSTGALFTVEDVIDQGWVLVATDYVGLGTEGPHPYLIGQGEGRSVLDSTRAARQMSQISVGDDTVVWGHSQGGHAALWTGVLAPDYAPEVELAGVAALAPASDLNGLMGSLTEFPGGSIFASFTVSAYSDIYDDVDLADYVVVGGDVKVRSVAERCLAEPSVFTSLLSSLAVGFSTFVPDLSSGALEARFAENIPPFAVAAPLLVAQGSTDSLVTQEVQDRYIDGMCSSGRVVDYRVFQGFGHIDLVEANSPLIPDLIAWTRDRLAGTEPTSTCP